MQESLRKSGYADKAVNLLRALAEVQSAGRLGEVEKAKGLLLALARDRTLGADVRRSTVEAAGRANLRWCRARTLVDWAEAHLTRSDSGDRERAGELLHEAEAEFEAVAASIYIAKVRERLGELAARSSVP